MKKAGVPETPLRSALSTSRAMRPCRRRWARSSAEALGVEAELLGVVDEVRLAQRVLMVEQQRVHLPEGALRGGRLGRLRRRAGACGMDVGERQVAPDVAQVAEAGEQLAHDRLGPTAVGALEVAVLDERHRRLARSADVVVVADRPAARGPRAPRRRRSAAAGGAPAAAGRCCGRPSTTAARRSIARQQHAELRLAAAARRRTRGWRSAARR